MLEKRQNYWRSLAAGYLFLSALGAMTFTVAALLDLLGVDEASQLNGWITLGSLVATGIGALFLLLELGNRFRFLMVFANPKSIMTLGAYTLSLFMVTDLIYATFFFDFIPWAGLTGLKTVFAVLGIFFALILATYSGLELGEAKGRAFWNGSALVPLFLISAATTGVAGVILAYVVLGHGEAGVLNILNDVLFGLVIILLLVVGGYVQGMKHLGQDNGSGKRAAKVILHGYYKGAFYGGFIAVGTLLPLLTYLGDAVPAMLAFKAVAVLIGGACLRNIFLRAAVQTGVPGEEREWYGETDLKDLAQKLDQRWQEKGRWLNPPQL